MDLKKTLLENNYSIVSSNGYSSVKTGIMPIMLAMKDDLHFFEGCSVADKIIGKASAMLLTLSGVKEVYTPVLSRSGQEIFEKYHVAYEYDELVDYIVNRKGDGMCPMEMTVKDIDDMNEAYEALKKKLAL